MKLRLEFDGGIDEEEVVIRCKELNERVKQIQLAITNISSAKQRFVFYKGDTEYYISLDEILFFETEEKQIFAHTASDRYQVKYRLYELEEFLPGHFMRVSKSTILNTERVYSIRKNLTASSMVEFLNTHKQVFVSRYYYKPLREKLEEKRSYV